MNAIQGIAALGREPAFGEITVDIVRLPQASFDLDGSGGSGGSGRAARGAPPLEPITGFRVIDNGVGFDERNMESFETLDSDYKASDGCRGVGRLLWLKAFEAVQVVSDFRGADGAGKRRAFTFTAAHGVDAQIVSDTPAGRPRSTLVHLDGFKQVYRERSFKTARTIAHALFEHCLWYFVREGGAPTIRVRDDVETCYVTAPFLDQHVRPERIGFDIDEIRADLFSDTGISLVDIRGAILDSSKAFLSDYLQKSQKAGRERVEKFVSRQAPRYRPILGRISADKLSVDPEISDRDLDLLLHRQLAEIEGSLRAEGQAMMQFGKEESVADYLARLTDYMEKATEIKKSDLANYVFHRKVILDIFEKAIERGADGRYAKEALIHELIMPMKKTSNEVQPDSCNLWLIDERLAFHDFLASDKPLSSMPITGAMQTKEPDLCVPNVFDEPVLVSDRKKLPLASIVIVEIKRPMRNDAAAGEDKDPVEQALGYLERIRAGGTTTASGRPIPGSDDIPGFCYVICDLTPSVERRCKMWGFKVTSDRQGYFGYNDNFKAYVEVVSFDRLLNAARERNRAFFDRLGLPVG